MNIKHETILQPTELTPVLLMCDFVDIDTNLVRLVDSVTFLPVCNIPLIQYALDNLIMQDFTNIFFCIKSKEIIPKINDLINNIYPNTLRTRYIIGHDYGSIMRSIDDFDYGYETFLIYPINFITNVNVKTMINNFNFYRKNERKIVMNILMLKKDNYLNEINVYGLQAYDGTNELLHYEKTTVNSKINLRFFDAVLRVKCLRFLTMCSSPRLCVASKEVFALFSENYDFLSMDCLVESSLSNNLYNYKFLLHFANSDFDDEVKGVDDLAYLSVKNGTLCKIIQNVNDFYQVNYYFKDYNHLRNELLDMDLLYDEYLCEYQKFETNLMAVRNANSKKLARGFCTNIKNSVVGSNVGIEKGRVILNCIIDHGTVIENNLVNSISFNDYMMQKDSEKYFIYYKNNLVFDYIPEIFIEITPEDSEEIDTSKINTFHSEILAYLADVTDDVLSKSIDISMVKKQVNLIAIIWKANSRDLIDVFTIFISEFINQNDLDQSTIYVSMFFPIIEGSLNEPQAQENFIRTVYKGLNIKNKRLRKEAFIRIGYAMMDDGLIEKDILNNTNIIKGNFFQ